jgi:hypothetical protein
MNFIEVKGIISTRWFYCAEEPLTIWILKSGFVHEPNLIVLHETPYDNGITYEGLFSRKQIEEKYKIKL